MARLKKFSELDIDAMPPRRCRGARRRAGGGGAPAGPTRRRRAAAAIRAAARESDANHEKTRRDVLRQTARDARAAKQRVAELARAHGVKTRPESGEAWKGAPAKTEGTADASAATAPEPDASAEASESESDASDAEPETFSDVDDDEVADYIHTEEEVKLRRVIWSELNKDYLETQAAKEAATATTTRAGAGDESAGGAKKKRKQYTHTVPADSAAEAAHAMLSSKKISSKINYDALNDLFKQDSLDAAVREARESERTKAERAGRNGGEKGRRPAEDARAPGPPQAPGRLSSRLAGFNPHLKAGEKHAPGLGGGGSARGSPRRRRAAAAAAAEKKKGEEGAASSRRALGRGRLRRRAYRREGEEAGYVGRDARRSRDAVHRAARREARQEHERRRLAFLRRRRVTPSHIPEGLDVTQYS